MRLPACVFVALRSEFDLAQVGVWEIVWDYLPPSITALARIAKVRREKITSVCKRLAEHNWLRLTKTGRSVRPIPLMPHTVQDKMVDLLREEYDAAPNKSEFVMKKCLDLIIHGSDYIENARLEALKNVTGSRLELDRLYREGVAFEYNGPQHLGVTPRYPDERSARELQERDIRKVWLCERAGITLIRVFAADLHPILLDRLVPLKLGRHTLDKTGPYYQTICEMCLAHIQMMSGVDIRSIIGNDNTG